MPGTRFDERLTAAAPAFAGLRTAPAHGMVRHDADRSDTGSVRQRHANVRQSVADESETVFEHVDEGMRAAYCIEHEYSKCVCVNKCADG